MTGLDERGTVQAPPRWVTALEVRAVTERLSFEVARPLLSRLPRGDGHGVLVLPGFMADDRSTEPLRQLLDQLGYVTYGWSLGTNLGPTPHIVDGLSSLVEQVSADHGPMSIVGWSLGGIFARLIAQSSPELVRQVITLGSPIQMRVGDESAPSALWQSLEHLHVTEIGDAHEASTGPLPVPTTAVYTRSDGVVHWSTCLVEASEVDRAENVEVYGSHCGLGFNPSVAVVLADRLAQPAAEWRPFRARRCLSASYPRPADLDSRFRQTPLRSVS